MISHGIKLSLIASKSEYPRDALVQVTVRIDNVSDRAITMREFSVWNPEVRAETGSGEMIFRSGEALLEPFSHGPAPGQFMLVPGESTEQQVHVILRAERLRPEVVLIENRRSTVVIGQSVSVALYPEEAPHVRLHLDPLYADIEPAVPVDGALLYQEVCSCGPSRSPSGPLHTVRGTFKWIPAEANRLTPTWPEPCPDPRSLLAIAG
jgi:hypothetical protein